MNSTTWGVAVACLLAVAASERSDMFSDDEEDIAPTKIRCERPNFVVHSANSAEALLACAGAHDAEAFLAGQGFAVGADISIDIVHALPPAASSSAAGCYLADEGRVVVLAYSDLARDGTWFGLAMEHASYRSLVAHEVAHAFADANFKIPQPAIQAREYIAYATMFATMPPDLRGRVLALYPGEGYEDDAQMSSTIYLFDPLRFGAQAYRHFLRRASGREYLHAVVTGNALVE